MTVRITSKGQVTIPADIRERAGLLPHTDVEFVFDGKALRIVRAKAGKKDGRGARVVAHRRSSAGPRRCRDEHRCNHGTDPQGLNDGCIDRSNVLLGIMMGYSLMTRDAARYRTYFPKLSLITPNGISTSR